MLERIISGKVTANQMDALFPWTWKADRQSIADPGATGGMTQNSQGVTARPKLDDEAFEAFIQGTPSRSRRSGR